MEHDGMILCPLDLKNAFYKWIEIEATWFFYVTWLFFMLFFATKNDSCGLIQGKGGWGPAR